MIKGNLVSNYFRYIIPSIASNLVFTLYTMVDAIFVSRGVSATALAAVNIASPYLAICYAVSIIFAVGTSTAVAKLHGQGDFDTAKTVFSQSVFVAAIFSLVLTAASIIFINPIATALGATESTRADVITYISWIAPFSICFVASYLFEILMATDGFPSRATLVVSIGVISNCTLDYLFIFVLKWGVMGAAFATSLSQLFVTIFYLIHFLGKKGTIKFRKFKFDPRRLWDELYKGMPSGLNEMAPGILTIIFVQSIQRFISEDALISYSSSSYITGIFLVLFYGVAQGCQPLISFFNGSGRKDNITKLFRLELVTVSVLAVFSVAFIHIFAEDVTRIFLGNESEELIKYSAHALKTISYFCLFGCFNTVIITHFSSMEKPIPAAIISLWRYTIGVLISIFILVKLFGGEAIWWAFALSEALTLIIGAAFIKKLL